MRERNTSVQRPPDQSIVVERPRVTSTFWRATVATASATLLTCCAVIFSLCPLLGLARLALMPSSLPARLPLLRTAKPELRMHYITKPLSSSLPRMTLLSSLPLPFPGHRNARTQTPIHTFTHTQTHAGTRRAAYLMGSLVVFVGLALLSIHLLSHTI